MIGPATKRPKILLRNAFMSVACNVYGRAVNHNDGAPTVSEQRDSAFLQWGIGLALSCTLLGLLPKAGNIVLSGLATLIVIGAFRPSIRLPLWRLSLAALCGACLGLVLHLLTDRFELRYVWLYSSVGLPAYLKISNLWGGDEGTVLVLATLCMSVALRNAKLPGWAGCGNALIAAWYTATAAWLGPFTATPSDWLAAQPSQGMNAHLQTIWMAFHAPLILAAYAWAMAPAGASIDALRHNGEHYGRVSLIYGRRSWLVLTAGVGMGMVWALEDFTFGQLWHWDPVQTVAFAIWALLAAILHGARRWHLMGPNHLLLPLLSLLTAALVCFAMAVTRSEVLASSHRYIGTTSWLSHLVLAVLLVGVALVLGWRALLNRIRKAEQKRRATSGWALDLSVWLFAGIALLAVSALLRAHLQQWLAMEKPSELKPFFETLLAWASTTEITELRHAFSQWDVDGHAIGKWLVPILASLGLVGGYAFLRRCFRASVSVLFTLCMTLWVALTAWRGGWLTQRYTGEGVLSQSIVAVLPWLDAALQASTFLLGASLLWSFMSLWRSRRLGTLRHTGPLVLIHGGAAVALVGGLFATALNTYMPINIAPASTGGAWHQVSEQMQVRVLPLDSVFDFSGYRALAQVELRSDGNTLVGHALYQDARKLPPAYQGPVRQLCEILDYRYARHVGDPGYVLHPFIVRGWAEDLQVWVPASPGLMNIGEEGDVTPGVVVVRRYPFVSLLWFGLLAMLLGILLLPAPGRQKILSQS